MLALTPASANLSASAVEWELWITSHSGLEPGLFPDWSEIHGFAMLNVFQCGPPGVTICLGCAMGTSWDLSDDPLIAYPSDSMFTEASLVRQWLGRSYARPGRG